jgi:hypothetical protein
MNRWQTLRRSGTFGLADYAAMVAEAGLGEGFAPFTMTLGGQKAEPIPNDFVGYVNRAYKANAVAFACHLTRLMLFAQIRFAYRARNRDNGRPGDLFHSAALDLLDRPWPGGTTADLTARMIQDADFAGNSYVTDSRHLNLPTNGTRQLHRLRPDWCYLILGSQLEPGDPNLGMDAHVLGLFYDPPAASSDERTRVLMPGEYAHFAPIPDPLAHFRGMSWLTPVLREIQADGMATIHKLKFFELGATPNMVIKHDFNDPDKLKRAAALFKEQQEGVGNAYRTLHLMKGADPQVVGKDFQQLDFKATQGAGETRVAAASGVHPSIVALSEGMQGSPLAEGNFQAARRLTTDRTLRWLWGNASASLETLTGSPRQAELWYDTRDVAFCQEDEKDAAEISQIQATTITSYITAGMTPDSAVAAVETGDLSLLEHSGLVSVQLLPPGTGDTSAAVPVPARDVAGLMRDGWTVAVETVERDRLPELTEGVRS